MKTPSNIVRGFAKGFTLIETLVVVSIVVLILALTAPSLYSTIKATKLTSSGDSVLGFLSEAQQMAVSSNVQVEVRFFKYQTPMSPASAFRSMQMFKINHDPISQGGNFTEVLQPVGDLVRLSAVTLTYPSLPASCITLCDDLGRQIDMATLPSNFYCIQIDPYTGKMRTYRPGQN